MSLLLSGINSILAFSDPSELSLCYFKPSARNLFYVPLIDSQALVSFPIFSTFPARLYRDIFHLKLVHHPRQEMAKPDRQLKIRVMQKNM